MTQHCKKNQITKSIIYSEDYGFLGHLMYSERLLQNIALDTVAQDLNLSSYIIYNLESGHFNQTPGFSYMMGFLRTYASYLGLDVSDITKYIPPHSESIFEEESVLRVPFHEKQMPGKIILTGSMVVLGLIILGYSLLRFDPESDSPLYLIKLDKDLSTKDSLNIYNKEVLLSSIRQFLAIYHAPFFPSKRSESNLHASAPNTGYICFNQDVWIALKDIKGQTIQEGIFHKGDKIKIPLDFDGTLHVGNAGGVYLEYNHQQLSRLGAQGQIIQNFRLNLKKILQNYSKTVNN